METLTLTETLELLELNRRSRQDIETFRLEHKAEYLDVLQDCETFAASLARADEPQSIFGECWIS